MKHEPPKVERSVVEWRDGRHWAWAYIIPSVRVAELVRRVSRNPNSQTHRTLRALGIYPKLDRITRKVAVRRKPKGRRASK